MITLDDSTDIISLPDNMVWIDEFGWSPVDQDTHYNISGALEVTPSEKLAGRPITLTGTASNTIWVPRTTIVALQVFIDTPNKQMVLTLEDGRTFNVAFNYGGGNSMDAPPVVEKMIPEDTDLYALTLRLMEI